MGFFVCFIYVVALTFRAGFGPPPTETEEDTSSRAYYFANVPRAMLTTFRCSFGDCSTQGGTPIFEFATSEGGPSGTLLGVALNCFIFTCSIGLFNIISAVFLERVMNYQQTLELHEQHERLSDKKLWKKAWQNSSTSWCSFMKTNVTTRVGRLLSNHRCLTTTCRSKQSTGA